MPKAKVGNNCNIGQNVSIASDATISNNVKIQNNVSVYSDVILEDDVFCGPSMVFTNVINPRSHISRKHEFRITRVKKGATIGANATIICGNTIGSHSFIGAGAVVTKDIPDHALVLGNPAKIAGWVCECGDRLDFHNNLATCNSCNKQYNKLEGGSALNVIAVRISTNIMILTLMMAVKNNLTTSLKKVLNRLKRN